MKTFKCVKKLIVTELDEIDGEETGDSFIVEVGEFWYEESVEFSGVLSDYEGKWLQIEEETLLTHFKEDGSE